MATKPKPPKKEPERYWLVNIATDEILESNISRSEALAFVENHTNQYNDRAEDFMLFQPVFSFKQGTPTLVPTWE